MAFTWTSHSTHTNESRHACQRVMSQGSMSHVAHDPMSLLLCVSHIKTSRVPHINVPCVTHTSHISTSQMSHMSTFQYVTYVYVCIYKCVRTYVYVRTRIYKYMYVNIFTCVCIIYKCQSIDASSALMQHISHISICHVVSHVNESCVTHMSHIPTCQNDPHVSVSIRHIRIYMYI